MDLVMGLWLWACCDYTQTLNGGGGSCFQVSERHVLLTSTDYLGPRFLDLNPNTEADEFGLQILMSLSPGRYSFLGHSEVMNSLL